MVGFVAGARAERVARLPEAEIARKMLLQLDAMFGTAERPHPASDACEGYLVKNWRTHPRTHGAYSHPTLHAGGAQRRRPRRRAAGRRGVPRGHQPVHPWRDG